MNRRNNWEQLLSYANEDVKKDGYEIRIYKDKDGYYSCSVFRHNKRLQVYAENFFEDELSDLVNDVWHYVKIGKF